jgi:hypothetical protein
MLFRLRRARQIWRARPDFARILKTLPLAGSDDGAIVFSQLQHKDVLAYLVAAKSFAHATGYGRFFLLDDGSLTAEDRALLRQHLPRIEFRTMSEVHYGTLPVGGTWERLITICDLADRDFVIQLDADTVTCGPLDEVKACVARGHSFTLMAGHTAEMLPVARVAELAKGDHVQNVTEGLLGQLDPTIATRYGCGCSGFAGFGPDPQRRAALERFSARMEELLGPRWREWGTDQVSSNISSARSATTTTPIAAWRASSPRASTQTRKHCPPRDSRRNRASFTRKGLVQRRVAGHAVAALLGLPQHLAEIAPAIGHGFDRLAADRDLAMHDHLAAEPLIEEAAGISAHHPDQRRRVAGIHQPLEQRQQQLAAESCALAIRADIEGVDFASEADGAVALRAAIAETNDIAVALRHDDVFRTVAQKAGPGTGLTALGHIEEYAIGQHARIGRAPGFDLDPSDCPRIFQPCRPHRIHSWGPPALTKTS